MKRFKDKNLTNAEWEEIFDYPKNFNIGDVVECGHGDLDAWEVVELMSYKKGIDLVYKIKNVVNGELACFSSTFLRPIGSFVDDEILTRGVTR